jgi:DNA polymerase-3 subunit beta
MNTCQNGTIEPYLKLSNSSSYLFFSPKAISSSDLRVLMATPTAPLLIAPFGTPASGTEALDCEYIVAPQE